MLVVSHQECPEEIAEQILMIAHSRPFIILVKTFFPDVEVLLYKNWKFYLEAVLL